MMVGLGDIDMEHSHLTTQGASSNMDAIRDTALREQLLERRERLRSSIPQLAQKEHLLQLLREVDSALDKMDNGTYGMCETCHESIEKDRLIIDPLIRNCLDHLTAAERRALEQDLELAYQIQSALLPKQNLSLPGWMTAYHYEPAGHVSGDYCDVILPDSDGSFYFFIGDVSGKGVSASILMAHLHAIFRTLIHTTVSTNELVARANRIFCEATLSTHFATLVVGKAEQTGEVEICNAGHNAPLLVREGELLTIPSTGLPLGLFCEGEFTSHVLATKPGDSLVLYTDGLSEARNPSNTLYGEDRIAQVVQGKKELPPPELIRTCVEDMRLFSSSAPVVDDLTVMVVRRTE